MSLNHIDTYRSDGGIIILLVQTAAYGGCGVTDSLASELKNVISISYFYSIVNCCLHY